VYKLFGYVRDANTGNAIYGATVTDIFGISTKTDSSGYYEFIYEAGWSGPVTASHSDYESQTKYITLKEGDNRLDFSLKPLYSGTVDFSVKSTATACVLTYNALVIYTYNTGAKADTFVVKIYANDNLWRTHEKVVEPDEGWTIYYDIHYQQPMTYKWQIELYSKTTGKLLGRTDAKYCSVS